MRTYTDAQKEQVLTEVKETGNVCLVARKNNIPVSTIHTWIRSKSKSKSKTKITNIEDASTIKKLKQDLLDKELENKILKDLLKKTYQVWQND